MKTQLELWKEKKQMARQFLQEMNSKGKRWCFGPVCACIGCIQSEARKHNIDVETIDYFDFVVSEKDAEIKRLESIISSIKDDVIRHYTNK